jgi:hypothetical protein
MPIAKQKKLITKGAADAFKKLVLKNMSFLTN